MKTCTTVPRRSQEDAIRNDRIQSRPAAPGQVVDRRVHVLAQHALQRMANVNARSRQLQSYGTGTQPPVVQRAIWVGVEEKAPAAWIHDLWLKSQDPEDGLQWHDAYRDAIYTFNAQGRNFSSFNQLIMALAGFTMADRNLGEDATTRRSNQFMAHIVHAVSLPSAAHRLELLHDKYAAVSLHSYGWSFCATPTMTTDVAAINQFLQTILNPPAAGAVPAAAPAVAWVWDNSLDQRVQFTVNQRRYSTHAVPGHAQLYPLDGPGVLHGRGPLAMARILQAGNELTADRKVKLYQIHAANTGIADINQNAPLQLGKRQFDAYAAALDLLL
jgi:hypothetical protein